MSNESIPQRLAGRVALVTGGSSGIGTMAILQLLLTYWAPLNAAFSTAPIGLTEWMEIFAFALGSSLIIALEKHWANTRRSR